MKRSIILVVTIGLLLLNGVLTGVVIKRFTNGTEKEVVNSEMRFYEEFMVKSKDETLYLVTTRFRFRPTESTTHEDIAKTIQYYLEPLFLTSDEVLEQEGLLLVKSAIALTMDKFRYSSVTEVIEVKRL
jgi:hypothetical protein